MLNLLDIPAKKVIGFEVDGGLEKRDIQKVTRVLEEKTRRGEHVNLYAEVQNIEGMTLPAMLEDLKAGVEHSKHIDKMAVVSDNTLAKGATEVSGLFTGTDINTYSQGQKAEALEWVQI